MLTTECVGRSDATETSGMDGSTNSSSWEGGRCLGSAVSSVRAWRMGAISKKNTPCSLAPPVQELHRAPLKAPNGLKNAAIGHLYHHPSKNHKPAAEGPSEGSQTVEEPAQVERTPQSDPIWAGGWTMISSQRPWLPGAHHRASNTRQSQSGHPNVSDTGLPWSPSYEPCP